MKEKEPSASMDAIPEDVLSIFNTLVRTNMANPILYGRPQKFNSRVYVIPELIEEKGGGKNIIAEFGDDYGEVVKYRAGVYLVKFKSGKYGVYDEAHLGLFQ